jgi:hypothetical protein
MTETMEWRTLTGLDFAAVRERMREKLPNGAYKQHPTKTYLTDIDPTYLYVALNDLFGPVGFGWGIDYGTDPDSVQVFSEERRSGQGREYRMWVANIKRAEFWYAYENGNERKQAIIPTTGSSENEEYSYALRGALTSAVGGACKWLEWQWDIYSDQDKKPSSSKAPRKPMQPKKPIPQPRPVEELIGDKAGNGSKASAGQLEEIWARFIALGATKAETINASLEKQGYPELGTLSEQQAVEVIKRLRERHWKHDEKALARFWAAAGAAGLDDKMAHEKLGFVSLEDFTGDVEKALELLTK